MTFERKSLQLIAALILFSMMLFTLPIVASSDEILIVADEWCPYNCAPDSDSPGYIVEIVKYAFEKQGHNINYKIVPWARAIDGARNGTYDAIIGAGKDEVPDFVFHDDEIGLASHSFFVRKESGWNFTSLESLNDVTLGVIGDYSYGTLFDEYIKPNENHPTRLSIISGEDALDRIFQMLMMGRIDVMVEDKNVTGHYLLLSGGQSLVKEAGVAGKEELYVAFSPVSSKSAQYSLILNNAIQDLKKSGRLVEILEKYGIEEW